MIRYLAPSALLLAFLHAQDVPPPPKPTDNGPSIEETMRFIQDKLGALGRVNFAVYFHSNDDGRDAITKINFEVSNVRAYPGTCKIDFHFVYLENGSVRADHDSSLPLKTIQEISVESKDQVIKRQFAAQGHTGIDVRSDPPAFDIVVKLPKGDETEFLSFDEAMANRIAKALVHAVELCGGGNKDPF
jgi:hypothetical protein